MKNIVLLKQDQKELRKKMKDQGSNELEKEMNPPEPQKV